MQPDNNSADEQPSQPAPVVTLAPDTLSDTTASPQDSSDPVSDDQVLHDSNDEPVRWRANEYVHHEKSPTWFIIFALVVIAFMAIAIFLIKDISFAILIPVMAAALLVYAYRPPRVLDYTLSRQGLHVNDRLYSFNEFKGFRVIHDGEEYSIMLVPTKRFKPGVSVYFPEDAGEAIVDMLGARLPMQDFHQDLVDKIIRKLRI